MSDNKTFNTRIQHKHDTEANWLKAANFIPLKGELIVYDADENYNHERIKMGNGVTNVNELPFISLQVDPTLTIEGAAADAKAVGDLWRAVADDNDVIWLLAQLGLIQKLADEAGVILTDEVGNILLL